MAGNLPSFRDYDNSSRKEPYGWDYGHGSGRTRVTFKKAKLKADYKREYKDRWFSERHAVLSFDADKWREFANLEKMLDGRSLREAVEFFLKHGSSESVPLFSEMFNERIEDLKRRDSVEAGRAKSEHLKKRTEKRDGQDGRDGQNQNT